ncbi:glycerophosphodiester phosphodiesterase [Streptomyces pathocidini]|uniref:Glycerophosphodiester phosphodiesterase n=1 Tax=Streptomyces pathocidini TaxID=1650571 RepID=A0ABW7URV5_9ACTN|nr:glycerophosphodiester phosphodiesterase [Streptomyces pathocidini]
MLTRSLLVGTVAVTLAGPLTPLEFTPKPSAGRLPDTVYVAHRGGALEAPENSMAALAAAQRAGHAQVLDFDSRMLRDGTLVVMHDPTLDRTTDREGKVRNLTRHDWPGVRLRPAAALRARWRPERPPTVAEVLDRFGGRSVLMVEAKDPESLPGLARLIERRGLTRSVFVNTNRPWLAERAHRMGLMAQLWRSADQLRHDRPEEWRDFVAVLDVDHRARDADLRRAAASGIPRVWAHTVDTPRDRDRALRLGCNGIITDAPRRLAKTRPKHH